MNYSTARPQYKQKALCALILGLCGGYLAAPDTARAEDEALLYTTIYSEPHTVEYAPDAQESYAFNNFGQNDSLASAYSSSSLRSQSYAADRLYHASLAAEEQVTSDAGDAPGTPVISLTLDEESSPPFKAMYHTLQLVQPGTDIGVHYASLEPEQLDDGLSFTTPEHQWDILTRYNRSGDMAYLSFSTRLTDNLSFRHYAGIVMSSDEEGENSAIASASLAYTPSEKLAFALEARQAPDMRTIDQDKTEFMGRISYRF